MSELSTKPYLLRALYEWCVDSGHTPHIVAWVNEHTHVPMQYVRDNEIVLNIGHNACQDLSIDNEWVHFGARFGGVAHEVWIPLGHIASIFARESGEGMGFDVEPWTPAVELKLSRDDALPADNEVATPDHPTTAETPSTPASKTQAKGKKGLKLVK